MTALWNVVVRLVKTFWMFCWCVLIGSMFYKDYCWPAVLKGIWLGQTKILVTAGF